jgi:hypothetical protein
MISSVALSAGWVSRRSTHPARAPVPLYWGNGMRRAERLGIAKLHLDLRRAGGLPGGRWYNFAALTTTEQTTTEQFVRMHRQVPDGVIRAIVNTQKALRADPSLAGQVGDRPSPPDKALLIARSDRDGRTLIERALPWRPSKA